MKKLGFVALILFAIITQVNAQHVRMRSGYPSGISVYAGTPRPHAGAIWIGPEWRWHRGYYVSVPGYWARPRYSRAVWVPGYWQHSRRGYRWAPGYWR